jgi:rhodanese-related sulfurtransferase
LGAPAVIAWAPKVCTREDGSNTQQQPTGVALRAGRRRDIVRPVSTSHASHGSAAHSAAGQSGVSIDALVDDARAGLLRLEPREAFRAARSGALLVDIRPFEQRERDGSIPGALVIDRNVLEWRLDPKSSFKDSSVGTQQQVVIICNEGYSSSLAAATLRLLGRDATDVIGGFQNWLLSGLPVAR